MTASLRSSTSSVRSSGPSPFLADGRTSILAIQHACGITQTNKTRHTHPTNALIPKRPRDPFLRLGGEESLVLPSFCVACDTRIGSAGFSPMDRDAVALWGEVRWALSPRDSARGGTFRISGTPNFRRSGWRVIEPCDDGNGRSLTIVTTVTDHSALVSSSYSWLHLS